MRHVKLSTLVVVMDSRRLSRLLMTSRSTLPCGGDPYTIKVICLSWNKHAKNHVATSDYEGPVIGRDVNTQQIFDDIGFRFKCECIVTDTLGRSSELAYVETAPVFPGEIGKMYQANVDYVGYRLVAIYTPIREDGVEGHPVSASTEGITVGKPG